jgi:hypothetical protein
MHTCSAFNNAESEVSKRVLRIKSKWYRTKTQLEILDRSWVALDQEYRDLQSQLLTVLVSLLINADLKISGFLAERSTILDGNYEPMRSSLGARKKLKYVSLEKTLDKTITELESWQNEFDPSWFLILKVSNGHIDKQFEALKETNATITAASGIRNLSKANPQQPTSVLLPNQELEGAKFEMIDFCPAQLVQRVGSTKWLVLDTIKCESLAEFHQRMRTIRDLARKLTKADPEMFSLLNCRGFLADQTQRNLKLVFKTPTGMFEPQSLRSVLLTGDVNHSLSDRFLLATQLARAVCFVHTLGLVHKSIRPENILIFRGQSSTLGSAFLIGFESIRSEEGMTWLRGDSDWEKNVYRHPRRQGNQIQHPYIMQHDIYSLGVCLLEVGLWKSFVEYKDFSPDPTQSQGYTFSNNVPEVTSSSESVKNQLLSLSRDPLRRHMGSKYANVVETCLTCLDDENDLFGNELEFQDEDGVLVAIRYIETVSYFVYTRWEAAHDHRFFYGSITFRFDFKRLSTQKAIIILFRLSRCSGPKMGEDKSVPRRP